MKCISLWQPWASLIAVGAKRYETRHWSTNYRGLMAIHAAKRWTGAHREFALNDLVLPLLNEEYDHNAPIWPTPSLGVIVAVVWLTSVFPTHDQTLNFDKTDREISFGDWSPGRFAWRLSDVIHLAEPVPCVGRQGIFNLPPDVDAKVRIAAVRANQRLAWA